MATINDGSSGNTLNGTSGPDILNGNGGADTIRPGLGDDLVDGGSNQDLLVVDYSASLTPVVMDIPTPSKPVIAGQIPPGQFSFISFAGSEYSFTVGLNPQGEYSSVWWGLGNVQIAMDGAIDSAGETLSASGATGNVALYKGQTSISGSQYSGPVYTAFTITMTSGQGSWVDGSTLGIAGAPALLWAATGLSFKAVFDRYASSTDGDYHSWTSAGTFIDDAGGSQAAALYHDLDLLTFVWQDNGWDGHIQDGDGNRVTYKDIERFDVTGGSAADQLAGAAGDDVLHGNGGDDILLGRGGNDDLYGGGGSDTALFSGNRADYALTFLAGDAVRVQDLRPGAPDGTDTVHGVEWLGFADQTVTSNHAPTLDLDGATSGSDYATSYTEQGSPAAIGSGVVISDLDASDPVEGATIALVSPLPGDSLNAGTLPAGISVDPASTSTNIVLVGSADAASYAAALAAITFSSSSDIPTAGGNTSRTVSVTIRDGTDTSLVAHTTIAVVPLDDKPVISTSPAFAATEQVAALINPAFHVSDVELDALNGGAGNYAGAVLILDRQGGANAEDRFGFAPSGAFTVNGNQLQAGGLTFANLVQLPGFLNIQFNSSAAIATSALVDDVLRHLTYTNLSDTPPASVTLAYTFVDGAPGGGQGAKVGINGDNDGHTVTANITAVNDPPTAADASANLLEDQGYAFALADFGYSDPEHDAQEGVVLQSLPAHGRLGIDADGPGGAAPAPLAFNAHIPAAFFNAGQVVYIPDADWNGTDSFTFKVTDPQTSSTGTYTFTLHVAPVNDPPAVRGTSDVLGSVTELADHAAGEGSATLTDTGTIFFSDPDLGDSVHNASFLPQSGSYLGTFSLGANPLTDSVGWSFSVPDAALDTLGQGQVLRQFYTVTIADTHGGSTQQVVEIDLVGTNDAAILSSDNLVVEQGAVPVAASGLLTISDVDGPALFLAQSGLAGSYGHFSVDATGHWSYTADQVYALGGGQLRTDVFTVLAVDGTPTTVAVTISGTDHPAIARQDLFYTTEAAAIGAGLNLFADNGSGADSGSGGTPLVSAVNGFSDAVGRLIGLDSGAVLQVNGDGTFRYDPNHAFDSLTDAAGATNNFAFDHFTYTLAGGTTATVLIDVVGLASPEDLLLGSPFDNAIAGTAAADSFLLQQGGHDSARGMGGDDGFYFGNAFDSGDSVDGGTGNDTLALQGNTSVTLGDVTNVENLLLMSGSDTSFGDTAGNHYSYDITTNDGNVAAGQTLTVIGTGLLPGENMHFDGSAEINGNFAIFAGMGVDSLTGGGGSDGFFFGADGNLTGADHVDGGAGIDTLALRGNYAGANAVAFTNSSIANVEVLAMLSGHTNEYSGQIVPGGFDYDVTMADGNVAAGQRLDVIAAGLGADESVRFDGRLESNGSFRILSGAGDDTLWGGSGNDVIYGGLGADRLEGGAGADSYVYHSATESTSSHYDTITGFDWHNDTIDIPGTVSRAFTQAASGALSTATFDANLAAGLSGVLGAGQAALFTATSGTLAGHVFAVIDANGIAGYQAGQDLVIDLVAPVTPIPTDALVIG